jgi:hypothetical protein
VQAEEIYIGEVTSDWQGNIVLVGLVEDEVEVVGDSWEFGKSARSSLSLSLSAAPSTE